MTTESKHTPGPWTVGVDEQDHGRPYVKDAEGYVVCALIFEPGTGEPEANARLIAAAPDLLEALRACHDYLSCIPESAAGGDDDAVGLTRRAAAAISKATGN